MSSSTTPLKPFPRTADVINVAVTVPCTEAEGPGKRFALWVQGCTMRCPGCCNPEMLEFVPKDATTPQALLATILEARDAHGIEGVTFLGGEPFAQALPLARLAELLRAEGLSVMVFTGYTKATLETMARPGVSEFLAAIDLLVDGEFEQDSLDRERRWIGSTNQQPHDLTGRYKDLVEDWDASPNTLEVRIVDGKLLVNGSPFLMDKLGRVGRLEDV